MIAWGIPVKRCVSTCLGFESWREIPHICRRHERPDQGFCTRSGRLCRVRSHYEQKKALSTRATRSGFLYAEWSCVSSATKVRRGKIFFDTSDQIRDFVRGVVVCIECDEVRGGSFQCGNIFSVFNINDSLSAHTSHDCRHSVSSLKRISGRDPINSCGPK